VVPHIAANEQWIRLWWKGVFYCGFVRIFIEGNLLYHYYGFLVGLSSGMWRTGSFRQLSLRVFASQFRPRQLNARQGEGLRIEICRARN
jgi:hypothetical protein